MRIEIRRQGSEIPVVIITFRTRNDRFDSEYEKSKFFRELHGWKQTVPHNGKRYVYIRKGLLGEIPHIKIAESTFIVPKDEIDAIRHYMEGWSDKVEFEMMDMIMRQREFMRRLAEL